MSAIAATWRDVSIKGDGSTLLYTWTPVTQADTCNPIQVPEHSDKSIQVSGAFGGTSVAVAGSNDGVNFSSLRDPSSTVIAIVAGTDLRAILENTYQIRPVLTGGAATSISINMLVRLSNPLRT